MTSAGDRFTLELPHDPGFVGTARLFASSLARHFEIDEDLVEDLKLAVSEAYKRALASETKGRPINVSVAKDNGRLVFEVTQGEISRESATPTAEEVDAGLSLELIGALFEDAEIAADEGGTPVVRFSVSG